MTKHKFVVIQSDFHSSTRDGRGRVANDVISYHRSERAAAVKVRRHNKSHCIDCKCGGWSLIEIAERWGRM